MGVMTNVDVSSNTRRSLEYHLQQKNENLKWLGHLVQHVANNASNSIFKEFPYEWSIQKSKINLVNLEPEIVEIKEEFGKTPKPTYIIAMPFHNASLEKIRRIIKQIEDEAFGLNSKDSQAEVGKRVAIVMGLNTFESYDMEMNQAFRSGIEQLKKSSQQEKLSTHLSITILPFFWRHCWIVKKKLQELLGKPINPRHLHPIQGCYRIAKSYFAYFTSHKETSLWISDKFNSKSRPIGSTIPYQQIRDKILHSIQMKKFMTSAQTTTKYILSLDGDFCSLKSTESGLLTHYDKLIQSQTLCPHIMSTGYQAPNSEENDSIKMGLDLDRRIRAAVGLVLPRAVYMPEPNFAFLVSKCEDLVKLSWIGKDSKMHTESRRLITNGIHSKIFDPNRMVFRCTGGIQTEIDNEWRTNTVEKFKTVTKATITNVAFQKTLRGLHQSFADPEIWANNMYTAFDVVISKYKLKGIAPLKAIRELFDPITVKNTRYPLKSTLRSDLVTTLLTFQTYVSSLKLFDTTPKKDIILFFLKEAKISSEHEKQEWETFMDGQLKKFQENKKILQENYSQNQIEQIVLAAIKTGEAIKSFYIEKLNQK